MQPTILYNESAIYVLSQKLTNTTPPPPTTMSSQSQPPPPNLHHPNLNPPKPKQKHIDFLTYVET